MDNLVTVHDFLNEFLGFLLIHGPDLTDTSVISLLKTFILRLQLLEVVGKRLIFFCEVDVVLLMTALFLQEPFPNSTYQRHSLTPLLSQSLGSCVVHFFSLPEHTVVEFQLLVIQFEDSLHVFHALLQCLHFFFQLNLLVNLFVCIS